MTFRTVGGKLPCKTVPTRTNLALNPALRATSGTVEVRRNLGWSSSATMWSKVDPIGATWAGAPALRTDSGTYLRLTLATGPATSAGGGFAFATSGITIIPVVEGAAYSTRVKARCSRSGISAYIYTRFYDASGVQVGGTVANAGSGATELPTDGTWVDLIAENFIAPAGAVRAFTVIYQNTGGGRWEVGDTFDIKELLFEATSKALTYFDGATAAANGLTHLWTNGPNASASVAMGVKAVGADRISIYGGGSVKALYVAPEIAPPGLSNKGVTVLKGVHESTNVGLSRARAVLGVFPAMGGVTYAVSAYLWVPVGGPVMGISPLSGAANSATSFDTALNTVYGQWQRRTRYVTAAADGNMTIGLAANANTLAGDYFYATAATVEVVPSFNSPIGPFFDGSSFETGTIGYAWTGVADASTSEELVKGNPSILDIDGVTWRSLAEVTQRINRFTNPRFRKLSTSPATVEVRRNYVTNPSFEAGSGLHWVAVRASIAVVDGGSVGSKALRLTITDTAAQSYLATQAVGTAAYAHTAGAPVMVGYSVLSPIARKFRCQLYEYDSAGVLLSPVQPQTDVDVAAGVWTRVEQTWTPYAATAYVRPIVGFSGGAGATVGEYWDVDAIYCGLPGTYFDGDSAPDSALNLRAAWTGTANASASILYGDAVLNVGRSINPGTRGAIWQASPQGGLRIWHRGASYTVASFTAPSLSATGNESLSYSFYATADKDLTFTVFPAFGGVPGRVYQTHTLTAGVRTLVQGTAINPRNQTAGTCSLSFGFHPPGSNGSAFEGMVVIEDLMLTGDSPALPFFDGSTPVKVRRNLCPNPQPATTASNWGAAQSVLATAPWDASRKAVRATATGASTCYVFSAPVVGPFIAGETFTVSATVLVPEGKAYKVFVHARTGNSYMPATGTAQLIVSDGTPTRVSRTFTLTTTQPDIDFALLAYEGGGGVMAAGSQVFVGDVLIERNGNPAGPYFDGSTLPERAMGFGWEGDANASASYETPIDYTYSWAGAADNSESIATP